MYVCMYVCMYVYKMAQMVKNLPIMQETWAWSLGQEDPLEKEMVTCSSILGWRIPWTEEPGELQSMGLKRVGLSKFFCLLFCFVLTLLIKQTKFIFNFF